MSEIVTPQEVKHFWVEEAGEAAWYDANECFDAQIRERFGTTWEAAAAGELEHWATRPESSLAYLIVLDQFPRNMFRGEAKAFSTDRKALSGAKLALAKGWDMRTEAPERQFFYMPLMHSENLYDQSRCMCLMLERMPGFKQSSALLHMRVHREVIRQFGRFPYRNMALGRENTAQEAEYLANGGYRYSLKELQNAA